MFSDTERKLREDICQVAKMMYAREFIGGPAGNISARLDEDRFLLTPSKPFKQLHTPEHLIIIDAIACGQEPGTVVRIEGDDVRATFSERISPHQLGISDVLAACSLTGEMPGNLVLFGVEPKDMQTSLHLSDEVAASLPKLIDAVARELVAIGCDPLADVSSVEAG